MNRRSDDSAGKPPRRVPRIEPEQTIDLPSREPRETNEADLPPTIARSYTSATVPSPKQSDTPNLTQQFGHYTLLKEIARGGMGVVFKARDENLNRVVALKMILSGKFAAEDDVRRFYQEAESAANLDHPGIVPIYEVGEIEGNHFFTMKLMEHGSLVQWMPTLRDQPRKSAELVAKVARAIHYAHQRGILHRDIKPANILVDSDANPLVSDLGLAKDLTSDSDLTHTGAVVGTPGYMPPEQAAGDKEITTAADIYGIGAILYNLLTGTRPHSGTTVVETLRKVIDEEPASPRSIDPKINRSLELICLKCLAKNPDDRYTSAGALADDLENWLEGKPIAARPPSVGAIFGSAIRQTAKSAAGSAVVGLVAGLLLSATIWVSLISPKLSAVSRAYDRLPSEPRPNTWALDLSDGWIAVLGQILIFSIWILVGWFNTALVRPKPGAPSVAVGMVAGLVMTLALYCLGTGYYSVASITHSPLEEDAALLTKGTVGTETQREYARRMYEWKYPDLANLKPSARANALEEKFLGDALISIPTGITIGVIATLFLCVLPCVGGTVFASHLLAKKKQMRWTLLPYLEVVSLITIAIGIFTIVQWRRSLGTASGSPPFGLQLLVVAAMFVTAFVAVRNWAWYWRISSHFIWILAALFYAWSSVQISAGYILAGYSARQGDWETTTRYMERRTAASPKWPYGHMLTGACHALTDNREGYRSHCEYVLGKYRRTIDLESADLTAKLCLLRPDWLDDANPAIELAKFAEREGKASRSGFYQWFLIGRTMAAYREGDLDGVDEWAEKCEEARDNHYIRATGKVVRAMALSDRGRHDEAKQEIETALQLMEESWPTKNMWENILIFEALLMEAQQKLDRA